MTVPRFVPQRHLSNDLLRRAADEGRSFMPDLLALVVAHCDDGCAVAWETLGSDRGSLSTKLTEVLDSARLIDAILKIDLVAVSPPVAEPPDEDEARRVQRELRLLLRRSHQERLTTVRRARSRFLSEGLVDALLLHARDAVPSDSTKAQQLVDLAELILARLPIPARPEDEPAHEDRTRRLAARCRAERANALRVAGRLRSAELQFHRLHGTAVAGVDPLLPLFPEDPLLSADLASLEASLRRDQLRLEEAAGLAGLAVLLFRYVGDAVGEAKALIKLADVERLEGDHATARSHLRSARRKLPRRKRFGWLRLCSVATEARCLCELGEEATARRLLAQHEHLLSLGEDSWVRPRWLALQGRVAQGLGEVGEAERMLDVSRKLFEKTGSPLNASLVTVDLALMWLESGRTQEALEATRTIQRTLERHGTLLDGERVRDLFARSQIAETLSAEILVALRLALIRLSHAGRGESLW